MKKHKYTLAAFLLVIIFVFTLQKVEADWTQQTVPGVSNWNDIVSSSDGTKLAASNYTDDFIYTSTDSGVTWTKQLGSGPRYYRDLASSADGTKLVAVANNGYVYTSTDSGVTWLARTGSGIRSWRSVVTSSDGMVIVAGVFSGYSYMSSDGGETWAEQTSIGTKNWSDLALSSDDSTLVLASAQPNYIYTSNDYGNTWTERTGSGSRYFTVVDVSSDGSKIVAGVEAGYIYTSTDGGVTWTERTGAGAKYWASIASSANGSKIITSILDGGDYVYISSDGGATWEAQTAIGTITGRGATISDDGNKFFVLTNGSGIWRYINTSPTASSLSISGTLTIGDIQTGNYTYVDADNDLEGTSTFRWLRNGTPIDGATSIYYTPVADDVGNSLTFEVTPVASTGVTTGTPFTSDGVIILATAPIVTATVSSNITTTSVSLSSTLESTGGTTVTERGFQYGTTDSYGSTLSETGSFLAGDYTLSLGNLSCGTTYYYRSFAINTVGTSTGEGASVQTSACPGVAFVPPPIIAPPPPALPVTPEPILPPPVPEAPAPEPQLPQKEEVDPEPQQQEVQEEGVELTPKTLSTISENSSTSPNTETTSGRGSSSSSYGSYTPSVVAFLGTVSDEVRTLFVPRSSSSEEEKVIPIRVLSADPVVVQTAETINTVAAASAVAVPAASAVATSAYALSDMLFTLLRLWNGALSSLGIRKKRRPWGTVYDSQTKQPLDPAYVVLKNMEGETVATAITDIDGRYGFVVPAGQYTLSVKKTHYTFPSQKLKGESDELYPHLYYGTPITVTTDGAVIMHNIPMDREGFDWNEYAKQTQSRLTFFRARDLLITRIASIFFLAGGIFSLAMLFLAPSVINIIILFVYVILFGLRQLSPKTRAKGALLTTEGVPLPFAILRFLSKESGQEIAHAVSDRSGSFYALVPNGSYTLVVEEKTQEGGYNRRFVKDVVVQKGIYREEVRV